VFAYLEKHGWAKRATFTCWITNDPEAYEQVRQLGRCAKRARVALAGFEQPYTEDPAGRAGRGVVIWCPLFGCIDAAAL
jgi:hypothetical protein